MLPVPTDKRRQKGFAIIYVALIGAFVLIPMAGLAIDFGVVYNVKARLQTACDAAAIGAGYLLHATTDLSNQTQYNTIINSAQQFFNANYGTSYMGSSITAYSASATSSTAGKTITVNATATVPMLFMRVLGIANSTVAAEAASNVRYIAMMIVVDRSGSIYSESATSLITNSLTTFVATSSSSYLVNGVDTVGMVSFGGTWNLDFSPSTNFQSGQTSTIGSAINSIPFCTAANGGATSSTNTAEGLYQAWYQLYQMDLPGSLNVIVLLTDGRPSAFTSYWTPNGSTTCQT
ncbi:MAG TPA: pilus assembly protein TadG-related protein, partial [Bryobacteraceae bacterium]|nr:pilus assembly protein TadG-related protein [Bryobacteraceae bacterium]